MAEDCLEYAGGRTSGGYGIQRVDGKPQYAHRVAWAEANGPIPDDMCVCHTCDNPACIALEHLFLGTRQDNMRDMAAKGRQWKQSTTHCPSGHELSGENLVPADLAKGIRRCLECARRRTREGQRRYRAKKKEASK